MHDEGKDLLKILIRLGQGRRKHKKCGGGGGPVSRGTFDMKRAPKTFPPEMLATAGRGGGRIGKINEIINERPLRPDSRMRQPRTQALWFVYAIKRTWEGTRGRKMENSAGSAW